MTKIKSNSKITFHWKVSPYDYSKDKVNSIIYIGAVEMVNKPFKARFVTYFLILKELFTIPVDVYRLISKTNYHRNV